jgi:cytochrome c oxidase subunit III
LADVQAPPSVHNPLALRHHFDTVYQQKDASTFGMWVFLITEIMFFGGAFTAYVAYRSYYPDAFGAASRTLNVTIGAVNTCVLLCSSLTMVLAVAAGQEGKRRALIFFLILTMILGVAFLGIKGFEWYEKFEEHHVPGHAFHFEGPDGQRAQLFFSLYFAMTGLHALHMIIGVGILTTLTVMAWRGRFTRDYYTPVDVSGLYWHFVDIIWIFLFPLLYLIDRHAR